MEERELILLLKQGSKDAFTALYKQYWKQVYNFSRLYLTSADAAEEVVQDAFLKMYQALPDFRFDSKFSSWFYRIVYRTALTALRGQHLFSDYDEVEAGDVSLAEQETATSLLEREDRKEIISQILKTLEKDEALLLTLYYLDECSVEEIVQITDLSESNVKTKLFRARKHFYTALEKRMKNEMRNLL